MSPWGGFLAFPPIPTRVPARVFIHRRCVLSIIPRHVFSLGTPACLGWAEDGAELPAAIRTLCCISDGLWEVSPGVPVAGSGARGGCTLFGAEVLQQTPPLGVRSPLCREALRRLCPPRGMQNPAKHNLVHRGLLLPLLWLMKVLLFVQHCSFTRVVCCRKSQCFPKWWEKSAEDIQSRGFACPPGTRAVLCPGLFLGCLWDEG